MAENPCTEVAADRLARLRGASLLALAWLAAAVATPPATAQPASVPPQAAVPGDASFAGTLPCADCAGQQIVLTLFADQSLRLHTRCLGAQAGGTHEVRDLGRWGNIDAGTLELRGGREAPQRFSRQVDGALRMLDTRGLPIASAPKLERAYLAQRSQPGQQVLVGLTGSFVLRQPEPGLHPRETLRIEAFDRLWPGETCAAEAPATAALLNTRWRVVEIRCNCAMPRASCACASRRCTCADAVGRGLRRARRGVRS